MGTPVSTIRSRRAGVAGSDAQAASAPSGISSTVLPTGSQASSAVAQDSWSGVSAVAWFESAVEPYVGSPGTPLTRPAPGRPDYASLATQAHPAGTAVVQIGDSLPKIAAKYLGDASRWPEIWELNKDQLISPDVVLPGMVLKLPSGAKPANPPPAPSTVPVSKPAQQATPSSDPSKLSSVTPQQLAWLGANDKAQFFAVLKPAAVAAQQKYGVPWQVTLAQAALESGWGQHSIGGYNIFGIKGSGPAGSTTVPTEEWQGGQYVKTQASFAKYDNFYQAVEEHGALFHNGYYNKAISQFAKDGNAVNFVNNIQGIYATSPTYSQNLLSIMKQYNLV